MATPTGNDKSPPITYSASTSNMSTTKSKELKHTDYKIFSCEGVFEPPLITSQTPVATEHLAQFQSSISFLGLTPPDRDNYDLAIAKAFVSYARHLFQTQTTDPEKMFQTFWDTASTLTSEEERDFIQRWLTLNEEKIKLQVKTSSTWIADLLADLTSFYNDTISTEGITE